MTSIRRILVPLRWAVVRRVGSLLAWGGGCLDGTRTWEGEPPSALRHTFFNVQWAPSPVTLMRISLERIAGAALLTVLSSACNTDLIAIRPPAGTGGAVTSNCSGIGASCGSGGGGGISGSGGIGGVGGGTRCANINEACTYGANGGGPSIGCCGNALCVAGVCVASTWGDGGGCIQPGQPCNSQQLCCNGFEVTTCPAIGTGWATCPCNQRNADCQVDSQCCSSHCGNNGNRSICFALDGCQPLGEACTSPGDCCSNTCDGGKCTRGATCNRVGEVCSTRWSSCDDCQSQPNLDCRQTAPGPGFRRCVISGPNNSNLPDNSPCAYSSQCESGQCRQERSGGFTCQGCARDGEPCRANLDCCTGYCSLETLTCNRFISNCSPEGSSCSNSSDCCGAPYLDCDPFTHRCWRQFQ